MMSWLRLSQKIPVAPLFLLTPTVSTIYLNFLEIGDVLVPGFMIAFLYRFDATINLTWYQGYFMNSLIGFGVGVLFSMVYPTVAGIEYPATVTIIPFVVIPTLILAWNRKEFTLLLGKVTSQVIPNDQDDLAEIDL